MLSNYTKKVNDWNFHDEIICVDPHSQIVGKIAILKKGNTVETISRAERLSYIFLPQEEKDSIIGSIWQIHKQNTFLEYITRRIILAYSNTNEIIYCPLDKSCSTIVNQLQRKWLEHI